MCFSRCTRVSKSVQHRITTLKSSHLEVIPLCFQVMKHLTKLFDSMAKLKFEVDSAGQPMKSATAMFSKDGEYVELDKPCDLNGQV